jgi:hypothetical protein
MASAFFKNPDFSYLAAMRPSLSSVEARSPQLKTERMSRATSARMATFGTQTRAFC